MNKERQRILEELDKLSAYLQTQKGFQVASESLYTILEVVASLLLAWRQQKGQAGWARHVFRQDKTPLFSHEEAAQIEKAFERFHAHIAALFEDQPTQSGGDLSPIAAVVMPTQDNPLVDKPFHFQPEEISLDKAYYWLMETLDGYDNQARELARQSGIMRFESCLDAEGRPSDLCPDFMLGTVPVPRRLVFPLLSGLLDMLRLLLGNPMFDIKIVRILLSISLSVMDLMRGDWKTSLISLMGVMGSQAAVASFFLKMVRYMWLFISPDLQVQLRTDTFRASKSLVVGFFLWIFTLLAPMPIRTSMSSAFNRLHDFAKDLKTQLDAVQTTLQTQSPNRVKIIFPKLPLASVPTLDDIQNLQAIMHEPSLVCTTEVQLLIKGMLSNVPLRLILELLNVPTVPQDIQVMCPLGEQPLKTQIENLAQKIQVVVEEEPAAPARLKQGGSRPTRRRKPRQHKKRTTRRHV